MEGVLEALHVLLLLLGIEGVLDFNQLLTLLFELLDEYPHLPFAAD
jgi:hypothetical protein